MGRAGLLVCSLLATACGRIGFAEELVSTGDGSAATPDAMLVGCTVPSAGSVACYPFEGNGSDTVKQNDATTTSVTYGAGRVGRCVQLDASSLIKAASTSTNRLTTVGTVAAWVRIETLPGAGARSVIVDTNSYGLAVLSTGDIECFYTGVHHTFAAALAVGTWAHVACAYDGSAVTVWKDGVVVESQPDSGPVTNSGSGLQIGSNIPDSGHPGPDLFLGMLDEVGIWSAVLTTADVCAAAGTC